MATPYVGFSNETLEQQPTLAIGDEIVCRTCKGRHRAEGGTDAKGNVSSLLLFYKCGEELFLAGIAGRSVVGRKADVSGSI